MTSCTIREIVGRAGRRTVILPHQYRSEAAQLKRCHAEKGSLINRTDRLLTMVLELQGRSRDTAADLARTFEATNRTICD